MIRMLAPRLILATLVILAAHVQAAKVVRLYNPWTDNSSAVAGKVHLVNYYPMTGFGADGTANVFRAVKGNWLELVMPATLPAGDLEFTVVASGAGAPVYTASYGATGLGNVAMNLAPLFDQSDTVWIVPTPLPNGAPKLMATRPLEATILLWNPWESDTGKRTPSFQLEAGAWKPMVPVANDSGWYSTYVAGFSSLNLLFRKGATSSYFGTAGVGPLPIGFSLDSLVSRNDTVWVWTSPEPNGAPKAATARPRMKTAMLYNPWGATTPIQRPLMVFGTDAKTLKEEPNFCGWHSFQFIDRPASVLLRNATNGQNVGAEGFGGTTPIDLSPGFASSDTAWITTAATTGIPAVRTYFSGEIGICEVILLGATIRDFDTSHPGFEINDLGLRKGLVQNRLGADGTPQATVGDTGSAIQTIGDWFKDKPSVNATTCRDIPLSLNNTTGNYFFHDSTYFPIDDFDTRADGTPNPFNQKFLANDTLPHNFHFCLESHAVFEYKKGQTFDFSGDDDVWVYIDKRLVVDLGGVHNAENASVNLDTLGLTVGSTYPFDFFFCERRTSQSNMRITTSLNLRNTSSYDIQDSLLTASKLRFDLYVSRTLGQGCNNIAQRQRSPGRFVLSGPTATPAISFAAGTYFGGISIDPSLTAATIDTNAMTGLAPGRYLFRVFAGSGSDTSTNRTVAFTVPLRAKPEFLAKPAYSGVVGQFLAVAVVSRVDGKIDSHSIPFTIPAVTGLSFFRDSLGLSPLRPSDTLMTGLNGLPRRLWLRGDAGGTYTIGVTSNGSDLVDTYPDIVFRVPGPEFLAKPAFSAVVGSFLSVSVVARSEGKIDSTSVSFRLPAVAGLSFFRDSLATSPILPTDTLMTGINGVARRFWVRGDLPGTYTVGLAAKGAALVDTYPDIVFTSRGLRYVDSLGNAIVPGTAIDQDVRTSKKIWIQVVTGGGACTTCDDTVLLSGTAGLVFRAAPGGQPISSIRLTGGLAPVWVTGEAPVSGGTIRSLLADSSAGADWTPVRFRAPILEWRDTAGQILSYLELEATVPRKVVLSARPALDTCVTCDRAVALPAVSGFAYAATPGGPALASVDLVGGKAVVWVTATRIASGTLLARSDSLWASATLAAGTEKLKIWIVDSTGKRLDQVTLEALQSRSVFLVAMQNSGPCLTCDATISLDPDDPVVVFSGTRGGAPVRSITLVAGRVQVWVSSPITIPGGTSLTASNDNFLPDSFRLAVTARPPDSAFWSDANGDGAADRLDVFFALPWRGESSLSAWWPDTANKVDLGRATFKLSPDSLHGIWTFPSGLAPLTTAGNGSRGRLAWDGRTTLDFPIGERIAPVPLDAEVRFAPEDDKPDTLRVVLSEPVVGSTKVGSDWFSSGKPSGTTLGNAVPWVGRLDSGIVSADGKTVTFLVDGTWKLRKGDSLRVSVADPGTLRDSLGNGAGTTALWIPIRLGPHPIKLDVEPYPPVREYEGWSVPSTEPVLQIFVRDPGGAWSTLPPGGTRGPGGGGVLGKPAQDTSHYSGIILRLNRGMSGMAYIYDNIGVAVAKIDLQPLANAVGAGLVETDRKGRYEALLAWNGMAQTKIAPSGVYLVRVFTNYVEDGRQIWTNQTFRVGWKRHGK